MSVLYLVLPISLLLVIAAVGSFVWAVRNGQLDDLETPRLRMLLDDDRTGWRGRGAEDTPGARESPSMQDRSSDSEASDSRARAS